MLPCRHAAVCQLVSFNLVGPMLDNSRCQRVTSACTKLVVWIWWLLTNNPTCLKQSSNDLVVAVSPQNDTRLSR